MEEKVYFNPGDVVCVKLDIPNKPKMIVIKKETMTFRPSNLEDRGEFFKGIRCRWFSTNLELQEGIFNTKDLYKIEK